MLIQEEVWKDVKGFEGYYCISNMGRIKSLSRTILKRNGVEARISEKMLLPCTTSDPKVTPFITLCKDSKISNLGYKRVLKKHFGNNYQITNQSVAEGVMEGEFFLPINGYEDYYEISNLGTVRSLKRLVPRRDGRTRKVVPKILIHNYVHFCLSKGKTIKTESFGSKWVQTFYPKFNVDIHKVKKVQGRNSKSLNYQYFYKSQYNPITVTTPDGNFHKFDSYLSCAKAYKLSTDWTSFRDFFFKDFQSRIRKDLDGYQFTFDHPVFYKGNIKITNVITVVTPLVKPKDKT